MNTKKLFPTMVLTVGRVMPGLMLILLTRQAEANPTVMTVQSGRASVSTSGSRLTVTAGNNAVLNWQSFNIARGETTVFNQPSASSVVWNRIGGQSPSQIYGTLQANGVVVLLNSSGFYFGPNSYVSAAGLVVSTANCMPPQNAGGAWEFNGPPPLASIVNYGEIHIGESGSCYLIADQVENHGTIETPGGSVGLASGKIVTLSERPDGRGMSMKVTLPQGSVDNYGTLIADAGIISLNAKVVNQDGFIQANSVREKNGVIELVGDDQLNLGADSRILAQGDASTGGSAGGAITLKSANTFSDVSGSEISVAGGANGGNGGTVEVSAPVLSAVHSTIDGKAQAGSTGGSLLLDPDYIVLNSFGGSGSVGPGGTVGVDDDPSDTLTLSVFSAFSGFSKINLQAKYDITLADNTTWSLTDTTGQSSGQLVLEAGRNIIFGNNTGLYDFNNWSFALYAGVSVFGDTPTVAPGGGSIYLNASDPNNPGAFPYSPNGYIRSSMTPTVANRTAITLVAGQDVIVGSGYVASTGGGDINVHALSGNIDTGSYAQGYRYRPGDSMSTAYYVDPAALVGGISTTAGGSVSLTAGLNVTSLFAASGGYYYDGNFVPDDRDANAMTAGSGAYGTQLGNFTIVAGGNVTGDYVVANGTGIIFAGVQMDAHGNPEKSGGAYVLGSTGNAGLFLGTPNEGTLNTGTPLALSLINGSWNVTAADSIILQEVNNPNGDFNVNKGTVQHHFDYGLGDSVNLTAGNLVQLGGSAALLPRLDGIDNLEVPIIFPGILNITAGKGGVVLTGDSTYSQLTLFPSLLGSLSIKTTDGGSLSGQSSSIFDLIVSDSGNNQYVSNTEGTFGLDDHASKPVHLNSETTLSLDISGDMNNIFLSAPEEAKIKIGGDMSDSRFRGMNLSDGDTTSIDVTGDVKNVPSTGTGYALGGGGTFEVSAHNIDLGTTAGIQSWGVGLYNIEGAFPLADEFDKGADIIVHAFGDLTMTSSAIASFNGGNVFVRADGDIEAGAVNGVTALGARGIYSTEQGDVTVIANGNINVNGSRIAAFNGGNVTVESLNGDINAGMGGGGFVVISAFKVNPLTHEVSSFSPTFPGSGILAGTYPFDKQQVVGNILVETPNGSINASAGGVLQLPLNQAKGNRQSIVEVLAGYELRDSAGHPVYAKDIASGTPVKVSDKRNVDASGSGIVGENVVGKATGEFKGVVFGQNNVSLSAPQFSGLTVLGQTVQAQGNLGSGVTLIGTESVDTSGSSGSANVLSQNANGGGSSFAQGTTANATASAASASETAAATTATTKADLGDDNDPLKKKKPITLARKVSRVTVILPGTK